LDGTACWGLRDRTVQHYGFYQNRPPARVASWIICMTWRTGPLRVVVGELERRGRAMFMWVPNPTLRPPCVGPALVSDGNYSCEWVVRYRDSSCEQVVRGEAESPRARRRLLVRSGGSSCEADTAREAETPRARRKLVGEVTHWSGMGWYCQ
jgi:hypothetical protein